MSGGQLLLNNWPHGDIRGLHNWPIFNNRGDIVRTHLFGRKFHNK